MSMLYLAGCIMENNITEKKVGRRMQRYKNLGGNSNVIAYLKGKDYIDVQFGTGKIYRYSYRSAGASKVEQMKILADQGRGLNSYIMRYARNDYER